MKKVTVSSSFHTDLTFSPADLFVSSVARKLQWMFGSIFFNWCTSWSFHLLRFHCTLLYFAYFSTSVNLFFFSPFLIKNIYFFAVFMFTSQPVPLLFGLQPPTVDERETLCRTVCYIAYMFIILCVNRKKNTYITHTWRKMCECVSSSRIYSDPVYLFILFSQGLT